MVVVPLAKPAPEATPRLVKARQTVQKLPWTRILAAGSLIAGGGLLLSGKRKAGLVAATTGASLALLDQQKTVQDWWKILPSYINDVQRVLNQTQEAITDVSAKSTKLHTALSRIQLEDSRKG